MVSVIVPVYNTEHWLPQCLDSLLDQTLRDMEIILINDGSTDGSGSLCEIYQSKDLRIRYYSIENKGLAAVRNLGVKLARGEWLMFADSDDLVAPGFCSFPLCSAIENHADMVIFGYSRMEKDGTVVVRELETEGIVSQREAVEHGRNAAWNKLYHKSLFEGIDYPEGRLYEDVATTYKLVYRAKRIVMLKTPLYSYRYRRGSISRNKDSTAIDDRYLANLEKFTTLPSFGYPLEEAEYHLFINSLQYLEESEPSGSYLHKRAERIVSDTVVDIGRLNSHERNSLKIWRMNRKLLHMMYLDRKVKEESLKEV